MKKMKIMLVSALICAFAFQSAYAVTIDSAKLDRDTGEVVVEGISAGVAGSRVTLKVSADGNDIYLDEVMSGKDGKYTFAFKTDAEVEALSVQATDRDSQKTTTVAYYTQAEIEEAYDAVTDAIAGKNSAAIWEAIEENADVLGFDEELVKKLGAYTSSTNFAADTLVDIFKESTTEPCGALEDAFTEAAVYGLVKYNKELKYVEETYPDLFEEAREDLYPEEDKGSSGGSSSGSSGSSSSKKPTTAKGPNVPVAQPADFAVQTYSDVDESHWAFEYVERLTDSGVISGDGSGNFYPDNNITREEFLKIVIEAFDITSENTTETFDDVSPEDWFYEYVCIGVGEGIIKGFSETEFGAGQYITRQDLATIVKRVCDYKQIYDVPDAEVTTFADDEEIADYAKPAVQLLKDKGIIVGKGDNVFAPTDFATRAECAKIVYQIMRGE